MKLIIFLPLTVRYILAAPPQAGRNGTPPSRRKCGTMAQLITRALYCHKVVASPWATNENQDGYDLRFRSSEYSSSLYRPKLVVTYKRQFNYVYYLKDHLGNIRVTVDKDGEVLGYDDYYPFGLQMPGRSSNTANPNHLYKCSAKSLSRDAGKLDEEIGLDWYYFGARYYDPVIARWLAVDPMADKYPSISPYVYCANNPLYYIDPNGCEIVGDSSDLAAVAKGINQELEGANVTVEKKTKIVVNPLATLWNLITGKGGVAYTTNTYFALSTNNSNFDWTQDKVVSALNDVINNTDVIFNVKITEKIDGLDAQFYGGGKLETNWFSNPDVLLSGKGWVKGGESIGAVFMHEALGHGHPVGDTFGSMGAKGIQDYLNNRNNLYYGTPDHAGYWKGSLSGPRVHWENFRKHPGVTYPNF